MLQIPPQVGLLYCARLMTVLLLSMVTSAVAEEKGPVYFSVNIEPGKWQALEVKNLPAQIKLTVDITTDGSITAVLINSDDLARFPDIENPLFVGAVNEKLNFSVITPAPDFYYVVMYNNSRRTSRKVELVVRADYAKQPAAGVLL